MQAKSIFASKTFWFNALSIASAIIALVDPALLGISAKWLLLASGCINIGLRFITTGAVSLTGSAPQQ
ncbi:MAG TPA: hypothetical protein P5317_11650 [Myxococcota bacterium]|nr:hypothetical protein [Myxococcota bacterium]HRV18648.1 hypothetical protein [Myxococcota bacterium]